MPWIIYCSENFPGRVTAFLLHTSKNSYFRNVFLKACGLCRGTSHPTAFSLITTPNSIVTTPQKPANIEQRRIQALHSARNLPSHSPVRDLSRYSHKCNLDPLLISLWRCSLAKVSHVSQAAQSQASPRRGTKSQQAQATKWASTLFPNSF